MLKAFGKLYGLVADLRNTFYDRGIFKSYSLGAKTISIGNITTGGTGKTPLVAHVAEILADAGEKVCILTRGYGRENPRDRVLVSDGTNVLVYARQGGDEPVELAMKLIGKAIVIADADRVSAAAWAKEKFGITAFVLDDGFQHRRAKRDLDIVCIDATDPFGNGQPLPAGKLREPGENLKRADAIVITRSELVNDISNFKFEISNIAGNARVFLGNSEITNTEIKKDTPAFAFCALGNPGSFFELLRRDRFSVAGTQTFPDHHFYTQSDVAGLEAKARECGAEMLLTTAKDHVKLTEMKFEIPCRKIETRTVIDDEDAFRHLITSS